MYDDNAAYELSSIQKRLWFLEKIDKHGNINNLPYIIHMKGQLDISLLKQSVELLVQKHDLLQNTFFELDGIPYQKKNTNMNKDIFTFEQCGNESVQRLVENRLEQVIHKPFRQELPLYRFRLIEMGEREYLLAFVIHHLIADGWSIGLLLQDIFNIYGELKNKRLSLVPAQFTYKDYIDLEQYHVTKEFVDRELEFWKKKLDGMPLSMNLPYDFKKDVDPEVGSQKIYSFKAEMIDRLIEKSKETKTSLHIWFVSIYILLLYKLTEQDDVVIGLPVAGRNSSMLEKVVGPFINTILMRVRFSNTNSFLELVDIVRNCSLEAYEHSELPFEYLVNYLKHEMKIDNSDLYQVMFTFQNYPMPKLKNIEPDLDCEAVYCDIKRAYNDLALTIWDEQGDYKCSFEYRLSLWKESTIDRMFGYYIFLAGQVLENDKKRIMDYDCMQEEERSLILRKWNDFREKTYGNSLIELFERQAEKTPDNPALILMEQSLNYRELNIRADRIAQCLIQMGIKEKAVVGIMMKTSVEFVISVLAVLKIGAIYVPIDTDYPMDRVRYIAEDSKMTMIVADQNYTLSAENIAYICFRDMMLTAKGREQKKPSPLPDDKYREVCIIYTSGSTGQPRGVALQNLGLCNLVESFHECYKTLDSDRVLPMTSIAFSSFVGEMFPILCCGGALVLYDRKLLLDNKFLQQVLEEKKVSIISTVPSVMRYLNEMQKLPSSLRYLISGGEKLLMEDVNKLVGKLIIINSYGTTETTICNTFCEITSIEQLQAKKNAIGKPILGNQIYILDAALSPKPIGVYGQIYISGNGLTKGYVNREEETARAYIQNPFAEGGKLYATGDWGRWVDDGTLEYLGRMDNQIKMLGYRIELEEIEHIICENEQIEKCMVRYESLDNNRKALIAYLVVKDSEAASTGKALYEWLKKKLPGYMKISRYYVVEQLIYNANGKLDRIYQYKDRKELLFHKNNHKKPTDSFQRTVKEIWKDVLKVPEIDCNTNFFDLGGNSLLMVQVQSKINTAYEIEMPLVDMFQYSTITSMAEAIETFRLKGNAPVLLTNGKEPSDINKSETEISAGFMEKRKVSLKLMKERRQHTNDK